MAWLFLVIIMENNATVLKWEHLQSGKFSKLRDGLENLCCLCSESMLIYIICFCLVRLLF